MIIAGNRPFGTLVSRDANGKSIIALSVFLINETKDSFNTIFSIFLPHFYGSILQSTSVVISDGDNVLHSSIDYAISTKLIGCGEDTTYRLLCFWHSNWLYLDENKKYFAGSNILEVVKYFLFRMARKCTNESLVVDQFEELQLLIEERSDLSEQQKTLLYSLISNIQMKQKNWIRAYFPLAVN